MTERLLLLACCIPGCSGRLLVPPQAPREEILGLVERAGWISTYHESPTGLVQFTVCAAHGLESSSPQVEPPPELRYRCNAAACVNVRAAIVPSPGWDSFDGMVAVDGQKIDVQEIRCPHCSTKLKRLASTALLRAMAAAKL